MRLAALLFTCALALSGCSDGAGDAMDRRPGASPTVSPSATPTPSPDPAFDSEAWRARTIERFGPETEFEDGSKLDYVRVADEICALEEPPDYEEGSLQDYILETYCPNV